MIITRREFAIALGTTLFASQWVNALKADPKEIVIVLAPSNLGLRPENGKEPGTWRAPQVLMDAGLERELNAKEIVTLERPKYEFNAQAGTRIRNGQTIRTFSLQLSEKVFEILQKQKFPVVIGGDCSILLGSLYGLRRAGGRGLIHIDGHSDFYHPGNYDTTTRLGSVAGMDLALASGRGESLLTEWPKTGKPLASDGDIIQIGERDSYGEILRTGITQLTVQRVLTDGIDVAARAVIEKLQARGLDKVWVHVDFDVLDQAVMPAVDSPGSPGFNYDQLSGLINTLYRSGRIAGINFAIYDPDRDADQRYASPLVKCIANGIR